ncbi:hypothetical protein ES703_32209 [subsurface metagenome]
MKKSIIYSAVILFFSFLLFSFIHKQKLFAPLTKEEISGERLWERITEEENFEKYPFWPGLEGIQRGQSPHGEYHRSYVHPYLYEKLPIEDGVVPEGGIIVKENLNQDMEVTYYTIMAKVKGYNPEAKDWFWAMISKEGKVLK